MLSQGVLCAFHGHHWNLVAVEQHLRSELEDLYPTALRMAIYRLGRREDPYLFEQSTLLIVKTYGLGPAVPHFLTQKSFTGGLWLGLAMLWWLVNLLEEPNDDSDDTHMDVDASRSLWALYHGRRPDVISLGCIHLPIPLNCASGVLSDGPYNAADVVNLLKQASGKGTRSESEDEEVPDPQTPKPKGKTNKQRQKEQEKAGHQLRKQEQARKRQHKKEEKKEEEKAKEDERANHKRKQQEDTFATAAAAASPSHKERAVAGLRAILQRGVRVGLSKSNGK